MESAFSVWVVLRSDVLHIPIQIILFIYHLCKVCDWKTWRAGEFLRIFWMFITKIYHIQYYKCSPVFQKFSGCFQSFLIGLSPGVKRHPFFLWIKEPPKIPCLDKCNRQQLVQSELLPDIFYIAVQTNLCRAQCTIHMMLDADFFWWAAENALHFLKCTCSSNSFSSVLGGLFVCLFNAQLAVRNWTFQLSGGWWQMSPSSASLPAVAACDSQGQVSALEKKEMWILSAQCFRRLYRKFVFNLFLFEENARSAVLWQ